MPLLLSHRGAARRGAKSPAGTAETVLDRSSTGDSQPRTATDPAARPAAARLHPAHAQDPRRAPAARAEQRQERRQGEAGHRTHPPTHVREPARADVARDDARGHTGRGAHRARSLLQAAGQHVPDRGAWDRHRRRRTQRVHRQAETAAAAAAAGAESARVGAGQRLQVAAGQTTCSHELTTLDGPRVHAAAVFSAISLVTNLLHYTAR